MAFDDPDAPTVLTPGGLTVFAGRFTNGATGPDDELVVKVPWLDEARTGVPVSWSPLPGPVYPAVGDRAWVVESVSEDGDSNEWVAVSWLPASLPALVTSTDPRLTDARAPTGPAGGDLAGTYPNPTLGGTYKTAFPFATGWGNFGSGNAPAVYSKVGRLVVLQGMVTKTAGAPATLDLIGTLPTGYRPAQILLFPVATGATLSFGTVQVKADGTVLWVSGSTTETDYASLSGISFIA